MTYPVSGTVQGIATSDFNGDAPPDMVTSGASLTVFLGTGDGAYRAGTNYATAESTYSVAVGYLSADDVLDIAAPMNDLNTVAVLLEVGDTPFAPPVNYPADTGCLSVTMADMPADSIPDVVVSDVSANRVSILLGNGDGVIDTRDVLAFLNAWNAGC